MNLFLRMTFSVINISLELLSFAEVSLCRDCWIEQALPRFPFSFATRIARTAPATSGKLAPQSTASNAPESHHSYLARFLAELWFSLLEVGVQPSEEPAISVLDGWLYLNNLFDLFLTGIKVRMFADALLASRGFFPSNAVRQSLALKWLLLH